MSPVGAGLYLLYDGGCPLCCRFKEWIERWDRQGVVGTLALDDPAIPARFPGLDLAAAHEALTVCDGLGRTFQGVEALRQLAQVLPGMQRLKWLSRLPGVTPVLSRAYRTVHRRRWQLCLKCGEKWMPSRKYSRSKR